MFQFTIPELNLTYQSSETPSEKSVLYQCRSTDERFIIYIYVYYIYRIIPASAGALIPLKMYSIIRLT